MELLTVLRSVPSLATLSPAELDVLAHAMLVEDQPDAHVFVRQGQRGHDAFLVVEGEVVVVREREGGGEDELERLGAGSLFGLLALVDDEPRSATVRAAGPVRTATLPQSAFTLLFNTQAPVAYALQRALAEQLAHDFRNAYDRLRAARAGG